MPGERLNYEVGDIVKLKKPHPCGSSEWEILRVGADFRLKCTGCGHQIMVARRLVEKNTKGLKKKTRSPVDIAPQSGRLIPSFFAAAVWFPLQLFKTCWTMSG